MQNPTLTLPAVARNPLVPAVASLLAGITLGACWTAPIELPLLAAALSWLLWLLAETLLAGRRRLWITHAALALAIFAAGACVAQFDQQYVPRTHIARFAADDQPVPVTAHLRVVTAPEGNTGHGNLYWIGRTTDLFTDRGWIPATGDVRVKWRSGLHNTELHRGDLVEAYGWLDRPPPALNPGAMDMRQVLAADRIFAEIRVPRAAGVRVLIPSGATGPDLLTRARLFLRAKLLEHTTDVDVESGYAMLALLLGHRDLVIQDVSQAFADAGVAHLLAISGFHIVFFAGLVWIVLRFVPLRPRRRELLVAAIVLAYVLATPCGPPVVRAAVAVLMVLLARLMARPPVLLNLLAAAAAFVVLLRPLDLFNAGFQLSFICTAGLILFATRLHALLFADWISRQQMIADLAGTALARGKLHAWNTLCGLTTANIIGGAIAMPLVAFHFGRINTYGVLSGLIAMPAVVVTMAASAVQLLLELISSTLGAISAPLSTGIASVMVWLVKHLAALPGSAIALRAPPPWLVALMYAVIILAAMRRRLRLRRAAIVNAAVALLVLTAAWYTFTQPIGELTLHALSVGQGSSVILQMPDGDTWLVNAGSRDTAGIVTRAVAPALRTMGLGRLDGVALSTLTTVAAQGAADAIDRFRPPVVVLSPEQWDHRGETYAGAALDSAIARTRGRSVRVIAGAAIDGGMQTRMRILWPLQDSPPPQAPGLILLCEHRGCRILLMEPTASAALGLLQIGGADLHADVAILLGPQRGKADEPLRKLLAATGAKTLIWSGRTAWAPRTPLAGEYNTADRAVTLRVDSTGALTISR